MEKQQIKERVKASIERNSKPILDVGNEIYKNPETGFKEFKTAKLVAKTFREMGLDCVELEDIPGVKATVDTGKSGPGVAIMGELDAIICREHPDSDPDTGAVHACGHNIQLAIVIGAAIGLLESKAADFLCGKIHFIAVPAEEYIETDFRQKMREQGRIRYFGGKPEFLHRGLLDDVDLCMLVHSFTKDKKFAIGSTSNGCIVKNIRYLGKAAHAGGAPHKGVNALYAANLGLMAINALRETFEDGDHIRVHPIITKGGDVVNAIPSDVHVQTFVRGRSIEAIQAANEKVDRALVGSALALGAKVEIQDFPGYLPLFMSDPYNQLAYNVMQELVSNDEIDGPAVARHSAGSTDMGDLSSLMPVIHPYIGGVEGVAHGADYKMSDPNCYLLGSKLLALTLIELLANDGSKAKTILEEYSPFFKSMQEYFEYADALFSKKLLPSKDYLA